MESRIVEERKAEGMEKGLEVGGGRIAAPELGELSSQAEMDTPSQFPP